MALPLLGRGPLFHPDAMSAGMVDAMSATLGKVLDDIRRQAGGPGSTMLLSTLGQYLLQHGIDLKAGVGLRLSDALRRYPGFCESDDLHVRFLDGPAESPDGPLALPTAQTARGQTAQGLRADLWRARVFARDGISFWMDLDDLTVHQVDGDAPPDPTQPWRYTQVPSISTEEQAAFVRSWLGNRVDDDTISRIVEAGPGWPREAESLLDPHTWQALRDARREWVVDQTLPWLDEHGIDHRRVVQVRQITHRTAAVLSSQRQGSSEGTEALRARIQDCVRRMTLAELAELRIPARFLL